MDNIEAIDKKINELRERMVTVKGTETEVYTRIVGYYRAVKNWNKGKRDEYNQRKLFTQPGKPAIREAAASAVNTSSEISADFSETPASYLYFYRNTCPNCLPVKNWLENFYIQGEAVNVDEAAGFEAAASYQIYSSPTVVFLDSDGKEMFRAADVGALDALFAGVPV
jgi:ribonucleoside-triphosphate reductase